MTIQADCDERAPRIVTPEYESYPRVFWVDNQLIVYRCDQYVYAMPQCIARLPSGDPCSERLPTCGTAIIQVVGTDATVEASISPEPYCFIRQRCPEHVGGAGEDVAPPAWEPFDPERDVDALHYIVPRWSPAGVWIPSEHGRGQRIQIWHQAACEGGNHVPLAPVDDDGDDWEDEEDPAPGILAPRPAPSPVLPVEFAIGATALYRYYDADDLLLYIGISDRLLTRTGDHVKGSSWMDFAVRSTIERFPSREDALTAEETAIKGEHPLFNHQHNNTPEARLRLVEYLIGHGRVDLLAPAVSRG